MDFENKEDSTEISIQLEETPKKDKNSFSSLSLKELNNQLNNAVTDENY
jgi:hypothetical protein